MDILKEAKRMLNPLSKEDTDKLFKRLVKLEWWREAFDFTDIKEGIAKFRPANDFDYLLYPKGNLTVVKTNENDQPEYFVPLVELQGKSDFNPDQNRSYEADKLIIKSLGDLISKKNKLFIEVFDSLITYNNNDFNHLENLCKEGGSLLIGYDLFKDYIKHNDNFAPNGYDVDSSLIGIFHNAKVYLISTLRTRKACIYIGDPKKAGLVHEKKHSAYLCPSVNEQGLLRCSLYVRCEFGFIINPKQITHFYLSDNLGS